MTSKLSIPKKKILASIVVCLVAIAISSLCVLQNIVMAAGSNSALVSSILKCVDSGQFKSTVKTSDLKGNVSSFMSGSQNVYVPLGFSGTGSDATLNMNCKEVVSKALSNKAITVPGTATNPDEKVKFLKSLGYKADQTNTSSKSCFWFKYDVYDLTVSSTNPTSTSVTQSICANVQDGKIVDTDISIDSTSNDSYLDNELYFEYHNKKSTLEVVFPGWTSNAKISVSTGDNWNNFIQNVKSAILNKKGDFTIVTGGGDYRLRYKLIGEDGNANVGSGSESDIQAEYTLTIDDASKRLITGTLTGGSTNEYPFFSKDEQFNMYQDYLKNYYVADIVCGATQDQITTYYTEEKGYYKVYSCSSTDQMEPCYAKATKNAGKKVGGIDMSGHFGTDCSFSCVANWLEANGAAGDTCPAATTENNKETNNSTSASDDRDGFCDDVVDQDGGIGSMQWILCPTLDNTTYTANWIDNLAEKYLEVDPGMYANEELKGKWEIIRNITNTAMVVFFMIIIGSQITGYGIDNYGIKKMLPRLIVMAIIINLSFYICTLAIDVSNILGEGLRGLFGAGSDGGTDGFVNVIMGLFGIGATGGAAAAGAATTAITLFGGGWIVLVIAVIVLVVVVIAALVVLLIMLGAREVIIVFCVISSPLAFAAFILPNTQNIFKKWWELFKAAIIIFPICGFVAGISAMLKDIDSMQMSDWGRLVMVVLPYLVFFLLPLLLKQALAALGKIGGALTAMGQTVRNGGRAIGQGGMKGVQSSERFKDWSNYRQQQAAARRAKRTYDNLHGRANLSARQQDRLKKAQDVLAAQHLRETENRAQTQGNYLQAVQSKQDLAADQGVKDTLIYNNADFVEAERKLGRSNRKNKVEDTLLYNDKDYVAGESALRDLSRENKKDTTTFYIKTPGLLESKKRQFEAQREAELRKMYSEKLANQSVDTKQKAFDAALKGVDTASVEETDAAFDALMATGDIEKILNTINTADFVGMKSEVRDRVIQKMLSSGDAVMKGFAKSLLKNPSTPMNFKDFVSTGGLANYLNKEAGEHGLDTASKDTLEFLAGDASRTVGIDKKIIANASISAANQNQKAADAMAKIITNSGQKDAIGAEINSKGLTNMNGTVARAYGRTALTPAITDIQKPGNEQILSNVGRETRTELGI